MKMSLAMQSCRCRGIQTESIRTKPIRTESIRTESIWTVSIRPESIPMDWAGYSPPRSYLTQHHARTPHTRTRTRTKPHTRIASIPRDFLHKIMV